MRTTVITTVAICATVACVALMSSCTQRNYKTCMGVKALAIEAGNATVAVTIRCSTPGMDQ